MYRYLSLAVLGFVGLGLAAPPESQAQSPVGVQVQVGPAGVVYQPGYTYAAPRYVVPTPVVVASPIIVPRPVYYPRYRVGYRSFRYGHVAHYRYHR
jgi:hypothetical protein